MCGIVGIFSPRNRETCWPELAKNTMMGRIRHRGPDGEGRFEIPGLFFGHTRLAVLDTSTAGQQPMHSGNGRFVVAYNGEIYNFRELRSELESLGYRFVSRSDTEVLLAAWQQWGEQTLGRLDGIFAFALFDREERRLWLVRDYLGVKPLFYQWTDERIFFASELLALFSDANPVPAVEPEDLDSYFTFNYLPAPRTGLREVRQLEAGCMLRVDVKGVTLVRYWSPGYEPRLIPWGPEVVEQFRELLFRSVGSQMVSDVPLGVFLSGGLDSYAVAMAAVDSGASPASFTIGFDEQGFDERAEAREYADHLGIAANMFQFSWDETVIQRTLSSMNELLADASCFPLYQLSEFARKQATVILAGDGGDELLAGYSTYLAGELTPFVRIMPRWARGLCRSGARLLPSDNERYGRRMVLERLLDAAAEGPKRDHASFRRIFGGEVKRRLYRQEFASAVAGFDPVGEYAGYMERLPAGRSYLAARQHADLLFHLPSILAKVDRMSMAHALEVRVPLLSREMVEFCINLDDRAKRTLFSGKRVMKYALAGRIPPAALKRRKVGLLPPVDRWFRGRAMNDIFGDYLLTARKSIDYLDWDEVEQFWQAHRRGEVEGGFVLLGVLQFINWSRQCGGLS